MAATTPIEHSLEESITLALFDLVNHLTKNGQAMAGRSDLTVQQWLLLLQVARDPNFPDFTDELQAGGVTASRVAADRGVARASVSALVSALMGKGMLAQVDAPEDRRRKHLKITDKGLAAIHGIEPLRRRANDRLFDGYTRQELEAFLGVLRVCLERVSRGSAAFARWPNGDSEKREAV